MSSLIEITDSDVLPGQWYAYRLIVNSPDGLITTPEIWVSAAGRAMPRKLTLERPWPNPSGGSIRAQIGLPREGAFSLAIFDVSGRLVRRLVKDKRPAGWHDIDWDGRDQAGRAVASGTYFMRLSAESSVTRRIVIMK